MIKIKIIVNDQMIKIIKELIHITIIIILKKRLHGISIMVINTANFNIVYKIKGKNNKFMENIYI